MGEEEGAVVVGSQVAVLAPGTIGDAHHAWAAGRGGGEGEKRGQVAILAPGDIGAPNMPGWHQSGGEGS